MGFNETLSVFFLKDWFFKKTANSLKNKMINNKLGPNFKFICNFFNFL